MCVRACVRACVCVKRERGVLRVGGWGKCERGESGKS